MFQNPGGRESPGIIKPSWNPGLRYEFDIGVRGDGIGTLGGGGGRHEIFLGLGDRGHDPRYHKFRFLLGIRPLHFAKSRFSPCWNPAISRRDGMDPEFS